MNSTGGAGVLTILITFFIISLIMMPIFAITVEKKLLNIKINRIVRAVDLISNKSYKWIKPKKASEQEIFFYKSQLLNNLSNEFKRNFKKKIKIDKIVIFNEDEIPVKIDNKILKRPGILVKVKFPIKPNFYTNAIMKRIGGDKLNIKINLIKEIPIVN